MNFNDLKNIKIDVNSLKNITPQDVKNFIDDNQVVVLNVVIALSAVLLSFILMTGRVAEYYRVKQELTELELKEPPIREYEKVMKGSVDAFAAIPDALSEEQMVSFITQLAAKHRITIDEFKPPSSSFRAFYQEMTVVLTCSVPKFENALFFVNGIETSKHALKVDYWSVKPKDVPGDQIVDLSSGLLMTIEISSIELTDNAKKKRKKT